MILAGRAQRCQSRVARVIIVLWFHSRTMLANVDRDTIFISHATPHDNDFVRWLGDRLTAHGYAVWADVFQLRGGTPFWTSIEEVLRKRAIKVIFVVSSHSIDADRSGVRNELSVADGLRKSLKDPEFIVPLRIDETPFDELPIQIHQLNTLDFSRDWDDRLPDLLDTLQSARVPHTSREPTVSRDTAPDSVAKEQPSLAILPFVNLDGNPEQDFFADGLAEEIITTLSPLSGLVVAARSLSFAYKGSTIDLRRIARELNVGYLLEGSVRKSGNRIRMAARLIDGGTGRQVWGDRYDRELADVFAIQDDVTQRIVEALEIALGPSETPRLGQARTRDIEALGWFLRARSLARGPIQNAEIFAQYTDFLRRAVDRDPSYAEAHAALALALIQNYLNRWESDPDQSLPDARRVAEEAIGIDAQNTFAHFAAGLAAMFSGDLPRATSEVDIVLRRNSLDAQGINLRGAIKLYAGEPLAAISDIERAMHLDPGFGHLHLHLLGLAHLVAGKYETAARLFRERIVQVPQTDMTRAYLAAALGHLGRAEEAELVLRELQAINPNYLLTERLRRLPFKNQADVEGIIMGWRRAGWSEGQRERK